MWRSAEELICRCDASNAMWHVWHASSHQQAHRRDSCENNLARQWLGCCAAGAQSDRQSVCLHSTIKTTCCMRSAHSTVPGSAMSSQQRPHTRSCGVVAAGVRANPATLTADASVNYCSDSCL